MRILFLLFCLLPSLASADPRVDSMVRAGRYADALPLAEAWVSKSPDSIESHLRYIDIMKALGLGAIVEPVYASRALGRSDDADSQVLHGRATSSLDVARQAYEAALILNSRSAPAHTGLATVQRASGDLPGAEASYRAAISSDDAWAEGWTGLGSVLILQGRTEEALQTAKQAMVRVPGVPEPYLVAARLEPQRANAVLKAGIKAVPDDPRLFAEQARAFLRAGKADAAVEATTRALVIDPLMADARRLSLYAGSMAANQIDADGFLKAEQAREEGRIERWSTLLAAWPRCALLWVERSAAWAARGDADSAESDIRRALAVDPENVEAQAALGLLLLDRRPTDALKHLEIAVDARPIDASLQVAAATAEARTGNTAAAQARLKETVQTHPYDIRALLTYGQVLSNDDPQATYDLMASGIQRIPDRRVVLALIGAARDAGRMADAARLLDELAQSTGNSAFGEAAAMVRKAAGAP